jgi:hypothetical protein
MAEQQLPYDPNDPNAVAEHVRDLNIRPDSKAGMILEAMQRNLDNRRAQIPTLEALAWRCMTSLSWALGAFTTLAIAPIVLREPLLSLVSWLLLLLAIGAFFRCGYLAIKAYQLYRQLKG